MSKRRRKYHYTEIPNMHEKPATDEEIESLWTLRAKLLSAHDIARLLEWTVNRTPAQSLDRETCLRVCDALRRHASTAGPSHPFDSP